MISAHSLRVAVGNRQHQSIWDLFNPRGQTNWAPAFYTGPGTFTRPVGRHPPKAQQNRPRRNHLPIWQSSIPPRYTLLLCLHRLRYLCAHCKTKASSASKPCATTSAAMPQSLVLRPQQLCHKALCYDPSTGHPGSPDLHFGGRLQSRK